MIQNGRKVLIPRNGLLLKSIRIALELFIGIDKKEPLKNFKVIRKSWPADNYPFTVASVPLEVKAIGRPVPEWKIDETGLCGVLPEEDAVKGDKEEITLIPMGAARLRISAFPNTKE